MSSSSVPRTIPQWPAIFYGTAWKEGDTERCVREALAAGFRGIDTANQRKHYYEEGVGAALQAWLAREGERRDALFVQTKYTFARGQDHRLPYDASAPIAEQVEQSCRSSLAHLGLSRIDSLVLHGPMTAHGLTGADREAWRAMEALHDAGTVSHLGISNVSAEQLDALLSVARVTPTFVQNRCYARHGWDADVRAGCAKAGVTYQGFSLLTANPHVVEGPVVGAVAQRLSATRAQVIFQFAMEIGILPLTGTTSPAHMVDDLRATTLRIDAREVREILALR